MADLTEGTRRIRTDELLRLAGDRSITARTLEYWRQEGLLPKAQRTGQHGKRPEWTYPAEAIDQLAALLQLRQSTKQSDVLRVALWFRGFPIETYRVRSSTLKVLESFLAAIAKELEKHRESTAPGEEVPWSAVERLGTLLAGKRGAKAPARYQRQTRQERARAMTLLLGLALGDQRATAMLEHDEDHVKRMLGLDRARRGHPALRGWLQGPPEQGMEGFTRIGSIPALIHAVQRATDEELKTSRLVGLTFLDGMAAFSRLADALSLMDNTVGLAAIEALRDEPTSAVWITAFMVSVARSEALNANLRSIVDALQSQMLPIEERARELAPLSPDELASRLPGLDKLAFIERAGITRLIGSYQDQQDSQQ